MKLFDSHCHIDFPDFDSDRTEVLQRCLEQGVQSLCIPGTQAATWPQLLEIIQENPTSVRHFAALGLHPCFLEQHLEEHLGQLQEQLENRPDFVVAVGEIGLDFFQKDSDRERQIYFFTRQLELAAEFQLPVILHVRKAHDDVLKILRQADLKRGGIVHAFSGSEQQASQYIQLGFKLGFGGGITYPRARKTRQIASKIPLQAIVLETDSPDMPLCGYQGQRNEPARIKKVLTALSELRQEPESLIAARTTQNAHQLLGSEVGSGL